MDGALRAVFVYGTLLPGEARWSLLAPFAEEIVEAVAPGRLFDTGNGYPAARFEPGPSSIPGVWVRVRAERWDALVELLDRIEGEGLLYSRVAVRTSAGEAISYEWRGQTDGLRELPHGWRIRCGPDGP